MADGGKTVVLLGLAGAVAYYLYSTYVATPAAVPSGAAADTSGTVAKTAPPLTTSVTTLAAMLANTLAAEKAALGSDPSLSGDASNPVADYDVHNYYVVHSGNGIPDGLLQAPDHTTLLTLSDYWAWAAPQLSAKIAGLSGVGAVYAGLGALARKQRGW